MFYELFKTGGSSFAGILWLLAVVALMVLLGVIVYRRYVKKESGKSLTVLYRAFGVIALLGIISFVWWYLVVTMLCGCADPALIPTVGQ